MSEQFLSTEEYVASEQLMASVNVAIALKKPLLIKGEPGTGKTMLAEAVAKSLGKKLIIWNIKSTTKAQDGLYMYDTIQRLYDGQFGEEGVNDIARYIKLGKLGEQTVVISQKGFDRLHFINAYPVSRSVYYPKFLDRDTKARDTYCKEIKKSKSYRDDIFVLDILREEMAGDDPRIQRILFE